MPSMGLEPYPSRPIYMPVLSRMCSRAPRGPDCFLVVGDLRFGYVFSWKRFGLSDIHVLGRLLISLARNAGCGPAACRDCRIFSPGSRIRYRADGETSRAIDFGQGGLSIFAGSSGCASSPGLPRSVRSPGRPGILPVRGGSGCDDTLCLTAGGLCPAGHQHSATCVRRSFRAFRVELRFALREGTQQLPHRADRLRCSTRSHALRQLPAGRDPHRMLEPGLPPGILPPYYVPRGSPVSVLQSEAVPPVRRVPR